MSNEQKDSKEVAEEHNEKEMKESNVEEDIEFLIDATSSSLLEIELGRLAEKRGVSPKVKEFGTTVVSDHLRLNEQLMELAAAKNVELPTRPGNKELKQLEQLLKKKGEAFDKAYIDLIVETREHEVQYFQNESEKGKDPQIKAFATGSLPLLIQHRDFATAVSKSIK